MAETFVHAWGSGTFLKVGSDYQGDRNLSFGAAPILRLPTIYGEELVLTAAALVSDGAVEEVSALLSLEPHAGLASRAAAALAGGVSLGSSSSSSQGYGAAIAGVLRMGATPGMLRDVVAEVLEGLSVGASARASFDMRATMAVAVLVADLVDMRLREGKLYQETIPVGAAAAMSTTVTAGIADALSLRGALASFYTEVGIVPAAIRETFDLVVASGAAAIGAELVRVGVSPASAARAVALYQVAAALGIEGLMTEAGRRYPGIAGMICLTDVTTSTARLDNPSVQTARLANAKILC